MAIGGIVIYALKTIFGNLDVMVFLLGFAIVLTIMLVISNMSEELES